MLCGTNTAASPVEMVLQAYGACLSIGYAMNAAVRGINIQDLKIDLEGEIDLPGFKTIDVKVKIKADASPEAIRQLHAHVVGTSPVGARSRVRSRSARMWRFCDPDARSDGDG